MNGSIAGGASGSSGKQPRRLVLCFDGTGNKFAGDRSDTNIVKIYEMLERDTPDQYHYYQPGIGTYTSGQAPSSAGVFKIIPKVRDDVTMTLDQALGSSFADHVESGYKFVMRYFKPGDHIYIFGFSRGAYTARFLTEMIHGIGLLSEGNEEMIRFALQTFTAYQQSGGENPEPLPDDDDENSGLLPKLDSETPDKAKGIRQYMISFRDTFCRPKVEVHFLGLFDCVNSVGQFRNSYQYQTEPIARYIRHAVSIHERRVKFKPALFLFDKENRDAVNLKEVWFAGNHGDVGGGWPLRQGQRHLLSETPLNWMIQEVLNLPGSESKLTFTTTEVNVVQKFERMFPEPNITAPSAAYDLRKKTNQPHDMLQFNNGASWFGTLMWWILEILPFSNRLELENGKWVPRYFPPNLGAPRDIPDDAVLHPSVTEMIRAGILREDQIQAKGGNNTMHFPHVQSFNTAFASAKKKRAAARSKRTDDTAPLLNNQNGHSG